MSMKNYKRVIRQLDNLRNGLEDCWVCGCNGYFCEESNCECKECVENDFEKASANVFYTYFQDHIEDMHEFYISDEEEEEEDED